MFKPRVGELVAVCYDGKGSRAVNGVVEKTKSGKILVVFNEWAGETKNIKCWFYRTGNRSFGGYVEVEGSLMQKMFGVPGDWYSVWSKKSLGRKR